MAVLSAVESVSGTFAVTLLAAFVAFDADVGAMIGVISALVWIGVEESFATVAVKETVVPVRYFAVGSASRAWWNATHSQVHPRNGDCLAQLRRRRNSARSAVP